MDRKAALQGKLNEISAMVRSEKVGEVASEFDHIHTVQRAQRVGSIDHVIEPEAIRPYLIEALERESSGNCSEPLSESSGVTLMSHSVPLK